MKKEDKKIVVVMLLVVLVALMFIIILPISWYSKKHAKIGGSSDTLVKEVLDDDTNNSNDFQTIDEQNIEEEVQKITESGQKPNSFYTLILKQIEEQKKNDFVVIPYDYVPMDNYLANAADTKGNLHIFKKKPIKVYVPDGEYFNAMTQAFASYNYNFKGLIAFKAVDNPKEADISVVLTDDLSGDIDNDRVIGLNSIKGYDENGNITSAEIKVLSYKLEGYNKVSMIEVYNVMMHEIGHAIGVNGHSQDSNDVMYKTVNTSKNQLSQFSARDKETIKLLYSNRQDLISSQLSNVTEKKLQENLSYAESYNSSDAYLSLADSYYFKKDYNRALQAYTKALSINPENSRIYIKLASCYLTAKRYDDAISYGKTGLEKAKKNEEKSTASHYIAMAYEGNQDFETALTYRYNALKYMPSEKSLFLIYIKSCHSLKKRREANFAYKEFMNNYQDSEFSEYEHLLVDWASRPS